MSLLVNSVAVPTVAALSTQHGEADSWADREQESGSNGGA